MSVSGFIVINAARGPASVPHVHDELVSAQREAARLAEQDIGVKYYVLEILGHMVKTRADWEPSIRPGLVRNCIPDDERDVLQIGSDDEIPF